MDSKKQRMKLSAQLKVVAAVMILLTGIEVLNALSGRALNHFGLLPGGSLQGILLAPFLHADTMHFSANFIPLAVFLFLLLQHGWWHCLLVSILVIVLGGLGVWFFGRHSIHVGASGLIYGYFAYLFLAGVLSHSLKLWLIALFVGLGYGGIVLGVLPTRADVSWEAHLFGFLAGLLAALLLKPSKKNL